ncbi:hypothetical protein RT723_01650 [Psychrosphaera aquimarina]|uniref:DUF4177 domain-containing protein n=1 Tax=Psychrosphaera aquimarina TaxID=2044854 RepID=A0ABU3QWR5_9GAMM|nr:hypothetical protein [Psychrosphaera aquimarina]MDU0111734.1 hypothetical protein [Psychrosphaera aquimarina]
MKKVILVLTVVIVGYFVNLKFVEVAYSLGFAELKKEAVLINSEKMKVKCHSYALGWFDEIKLENKFQACVNEHEANGYKVVDSSST